MIEALNRHLQIIFSLTLDLNPNKYKNFFRFSERNHDDGTPLITENRDTNQQIRSDAIEK